MIKNIILLAIILILVDYSFLYLVSDSFKRVVNKIQGSPLKIKLLPTILCYIILVFALYYFIILKKASYFDAFLLGFVIYGIYETTNMAIFKDWDYKIGFIDMAWGGILYLITTYLYLNIIKILI